MDNERLYLDTPQSMTMLRLFESLEASMDYYSGPSINVYLAGGMAVHLYTGARSTTDIDDLLLFLASSMSKHAS